MGISSQRAREVWSDPDKRSRGKISAAVKAAWARGAYVGRVKPTPPRSVRVLPMMTNHQFNQYTAMRKAGVTRGAAASSALLIDPGIRLPPGGVQAEKYRFIEQLEIGQAGEVMLSDMSYETTRVNVRDAVYKASRDRARKLGRRFSLRMLKDSIIITRVS